MIGSDYNLSQLESEKLLIANRIKGFDPKKSRAMVFLKEHFKEIPNRRELVSLARVCSKFTGIYLDREAYRRKAVLFIWFDEHINEIRPFIEQHVVVHLNDQTVL